VSETDLIVRLTTGLQAEDSVIIGPGDDCAVIDLGMTDDYCLFKTDAIVEGIHFTSNTSAEMIGRKAIARPFSDIAAMGGSPSQALITLGLPNEHCEDRIAAIYEGIKAIATQHKTSIAGGETTRSKELWLSISVIGKVDRKHCITRTGSVAGDAIFVTGELGGSLDGKHLEFTPRIQEGRWLAQEFDIHAMIDLSDGLATDLRHLLDKKLGAELLTTAIPVSRAAKLRAKETPVGKTALLAALTDGEDYELLFTLPAEDAVKLHDAWKDKFPDLSLKCIGKITGEPGIILRDKKGIHPLSVHGYDHLQKS
jgi:thiamine-monophosphate kinase